MTAFLGISWSVIFVAIIILMAVVLPNLTYVGGINGLIGAELLIGIPTVFLLICFIAVSNQLFSWGYFGKEAIKVISLFRRTFEIRYDEMVDIGLAYYIHPIGRSGNGYPYAFIYFSKEYIEPKYKSAINNKRPSKNMIKMGCSEKNIEFLKAVLPKKQLKSLMSSYTNFKKIK